MIFWPMKDSDDAKCIFKEYSIERCRVEECGKEASVRCSYGGLCREHAEYAIGVTEANTKLYKGDRSVIPTDLFFKAVDSSQAARDARHERERKARA